MPILPGAQKFNLHDARYILERASARETAARVGGRRAREAVAARIWRRNFEPHASPWATCKLEREATLGRNCGRLRESGIAAALRRRRDTEERMKAEVDHVLRAGDSVGGIFEVVARGRARRPGHARAMGRKARCAHRARDHVDSGGKGCGNRRGRRGRGSLRHRSAGRNSL